MTKKIFLSVFLVLLIGIVGFSHKSTANNIVYAQANDPGEPAGPYADTDQPAGPYADTGQPYGPRLDTSVEPYSQDDGPTGGYNFKIPLEGTLTEMLAPFFMRIISFLLAIVGLLATVGIIYSSYILATSGGNEQTIQTGKKGITNAVIGLVVALTGFLIIYTLQTLLGI